MNHNWAGTNGKQILTANINNSKQESRVAMLISDLSNETDMVL